MPDAKRGRPPVSTDPDPPARVHVTVPPRTYDRVQEIAKRDGLSVPEVVRRAVQRALEDDTDDE